MIKHDSNYPKHAKREPETREASHISESPHLIRTITAAIVAFAILLGCGFALHSCAQGEQSTPGANTTIDPEETVQAEEALQAEDVPFDQAETLDRALLASILESEDLADELIQKAQHDDDLCWIAAHPEAYAVDEKWVQRKLLKLATQEPEAIPFVRAWPASYPAKEGEPYSVYDLTNGIPRLYQWDMRWGYTVYSSTTFALTGCGPTSLAMVYQGLTGRYDLTPYDLGVRANEDGYMSEYNGTFTKFFLDEADDLGLICHEITVSAERLRSVLTDGAVVIANVGPGDFTEGGHFIVIVGLDEEGKLIINDPFSVERSNVTWNVDVVVSQSLAFFAYELA